MFVDKKLIALVEETKIGIANARAASAKLAVREIFDVKWKEIMSDALSDLTIEQKVQSFDDLAKFVFNIAGTTKSYIKDKDCDSEHYAYEAIIRAILGPDIFMALNEIDNLSAAEYD